MVDIDASLRDVGENVDLADRADCSPDDAVDVVFVGDVARHRDGLPALRLHLFDEVLKAIAATCGDDYRGALFGHSNCAGTTDASAGAGHDRDATIQDAHGLSSCVSS